MPQQPKKKQQPSWTVSMLFLSGLNKFHLFELPGRNWVWLAFWLTSYCVIDQNGKYMHCFLNFKSFMLGCFCWCLWHRSPYPSWRVSIITFSCCTWPWILWNSWTSWRRCQAYCSWWQVCHYVEQWFLFQLLEYFGSYLIFIMVIHGMYEQDMKVSLSAVRITVTKSGLDKICTCIN